MKNESVQNKKIYIKEFKYWIKQSQSDKNKKNKLRQHLYN